MSSPLVSVIVPVYNAGAYLRPAVESIARQTYERLEIIVVDDGCTDGCMASLAEVRDARLVIRHQENGGKSKALNRALGMLKGEFWTIQDADDWSYPDRVATQVNALLREPDLAGVLTGNDLLADGRRFAPRFREKPRSACRRDVEGFRLPAHDATGMYRASAVSGMRFDEALRIGQGVDFVLRVGEQMPIKVLGACLYSHRIHRSSTTHQDPSRNVALINEVIRKACERRGLPFHEHRRPDVRQSRFFAHRHVDTIISYAVDSVGQLKGAGRWREALRTALWSVQMHPCDPLYYKPLLRFLVPTGVRGRYAPAGMT